MAIRGVYSENSQVSTDKIQINTRLDKPTALTRVTDLESL